MTLQTLLIFDIDGTICQTKEVGDNCFIEVFEYLYQCKLQNINWETFVNVTDSALYFDLYKLNFGVAPTEKEIQNFKDEYYRQLLHLTITEKDKFKLVDGSNEFLSKCKQNEIPIAIATGSWIEIALLKMNACNLNLDNIPIRSSDNHYQRTEIVKSAIDKSKQFYKIKNFDKITYFGDGIWDKKCCDELAINFIGIDIDNNQKLQKAGVEKVFRDFIYMSENVLTLA